MYHWRKNSALILAGALLLGSCLSVSAEETNPAGYHVYEVEEDSASDTWYGIARGDHLSTAKSTISKVDGTHVRVSGSTYAHHTCDDVRVRVYLDRSSDASSWGNVDYWSAVKTNAATASVQSGDYKVSAGYYYRAQGAHSVTKGDDTESTGTCSNALKL